jgi:hypothetical protein
MTKTPDNDATPQIDYEHLVEAALRNVVRDALRVAEQNGLPGDTHFYITFLTEHPGVEIPDRLRNSHPEKMTIILQHQFWDLEIEEEKFSVALSFGGQRETLVIPFMAVIDFSDPSVSFGLQFATDDSDDDSEIEEKEFLPESHQNQDVGDTSADVVSLDTFRNKN